MRTTVIGGGNIGTVLAALLSAVLLSACGDRPREAEAVDVTAVPATAPVKTPAPTQAPPAAQTA